MGKGGPEMWIIRVLGVIGINPDFAYFKGEELFRRAA
jgi:hypothetical protein